MCEHVMNIYSRSIHMKFYEVEIGLTQRNKEKHTEKQKHRVVTFQSALNSLT